MNSDNLGTVIAVGIFVVLVVLLSWASIAAPCESFRYASQQDIPARCFENFKGAE